MQVKRLIKIDKIIKKLVRGKLGKYPQRIPIPVKKELNNKKIMYTKKTMLPAKDYPKTLKRNRGKNVPKKASQWLL